MIDFKVEEDKCIECGLCKEDCPVGIIKLTPKASIALEKEKNCLKCQHCLAICPTAAISILGKKPEDSISCKAEVPSATAMSNHIKTRRSIRKFKAENIDPELIQKVMETASHAPTGHNDNAVLFSLIDNMEDMNLFRDAIYAAIKKAVEEKRLPRKYFSLASFQKVWEKTGMDIIFRNSPHLLIATAPEKDASPKVDSMITLTYFEFAANANGLGTLWNGMVTWVIEEIDPSVRDLIGIPKDHCIGYTLLFGKSAVKYARGIQSEGLHLNKISLKK
ncbi:nitroreductase family protein [Marinifilum caeruleilacunae]|uniref:4Fe-4S dicluster domain-containing protein n=1 Tax=Marinifilum caeruleilacunae TaxID=2499076 RepID=A0ABX1WQU2_9BACT|nr:nitroreductase family protein [Marinifilum caeruleilacunae]NOU58455.1 4Fe-4S dicluster domain-containing protein [Marinifilum caeruleilacunae]